jgi:hypothetical protein
MLGTLHHTGVLDFIVTPPNRLLFTHERGAKKFQILPYKPNAYFQSNTWTIEKYMRREEYKNIGENK